MASLRSQGLVVETQFATNLREVSLAQCCGFKCFLHRAPLGIPAARQKHRPNPDDLEETLLEAGPFWDVSCTDLCWTLVSVDSSQGATDAIDTVSHDAGRWTCFGPPELGMSQQGAPNLSIGESPQSRSILFPP